MSLSLQMSCSIFGKLPLSWLGQVSEVTFTPYMTVMTLDHNMTVS
jgi:hypothetical protein